MLRSYIKKTFKIKSCSEATLRKLSKDETIILFLNFQNKFDTTLTRMNTELSDLRRDLLDVEQIYIQLE